MKSLSSKNKKIIVTLLKTYYMHIFIFPYIFLISFIVFAFCLLIGFFGIIGFILKLCCMILNPVQQQTLWHHHKD
ncbi:hypothetical protein BpHYR1_032236 [Brachionus plicatilis]|uniref:Uncharacterized protein n=1 Tax=Brachionus plicatilis TaxID=10195 RepID=A0A3M7T9Q1_BRAPC|nr:hypothetical protein BpHYR1_032236 [Brachionus plicatilis]